MTRRWFVLVHGLVLGTMFVSTTCGQSSTPTQAESRSLLPDWFGRRTQQRPASQTGQAAQPNAQSNQVAQPPARSSASPRTASLPRVGSTQPSATLPGLGGSPLPQGDRAPSQNSAARRVDISRDIVSDYPVIREVSPRQKTSDAVNTARPAGEQQAPIAARRSPSLRSMPQADPEEIRRELGGFRPAAGGQLGDNHFEPQDMQQPSAAPREAPEPEMPHTMPLAEQSPWSEATPTIDNTKTDEPQPATRFDASSPESPSEASDAAPDSHSSLDSGNVAPSPKLEVAPSTGPTIRGKEAFGEALQVASGGDPSVLASNQMPVITADIRGPKQITIGREAVFRVRLQNQGAAAAEGIVVNIRIPSWADVVDAKATQGMVQPAQSAATPSQLEWQLARLDGRDSETLDVRLVPRESRPLELGVSWTLAPLGSRAIVEVQEPKLKVDIAGPSEVLFEKPEVFRLTIANPGTGPAENVKIELVPPGGGETTNHPLGALLPGESRSVEIELTAREAGKLSVKAVASAEGGLASDVSKEIFCRKPELEVEWRGPATKYAGTAATYFFRVRNPGTAPAEDVTVKVTLPEGVEVLSGSDGQLFDAHKREVAWRVGTLGPGDDKYMEFKCVVKTPGVNEFRVVAATPSGTLTDSETAETNVVALADLKLDITDPSGPVAVGSPAVYEIRIQNRGAIAAKDVNVVALFSEGIEPEQAEGANYTVADGRVSFRAIEELPAGRDITLRIRAHAVQPGTHVFRAEVICRDAEIKLAAEETTRFYTDEVAPEPTQSAGQ